MAGERTNFAFYDSIIVDVLRLFGNCWEYTIASKSNTMERSFTVYLSDSAIISLFLLLIKVTHGILEMAVPQLMQDKFKGFCVLESIEAFLKCLESWFVLAFTIDRWISMRFPLKRLLYCSQSKAIFITLLTVLFSLIAYIAPMILASQKHKNASRVTLIIGRW